jgi:hypothetical protein
MQPIYTTAKLKYHSLLFFNRKRRAAIMRRQTLYPLLSLSLFLSPLASAEFVFIQQDVLRRGEATLLFSGFHFVFMILIFLES